MPQRSKKAPLSIKTIFACEFVAFFSTAFTAYKSFSNRTVDFQYSHLFFQLFNLTLMGMILVSIWKRFKYTSQIGIVVNAYAVVLALNAFINQLKNYIFSSQDMLKSAEFADLTEFQKIALNQTHALYILIPFLISLVYGIFSISIFYRKKQLFNVG